LQRLYRELLQLEYVGFHEVGACSIEVTSLEVSLKLDDYSHEVLVNVFVSENYTWLRLQISNQFSGETIDEFYSLFLVFKNALPDVTQVS